jgi:cytochrome b pre-mRNA-processing protein 3
MIFNLFRKPPAADAALACYRAIVAQSRQERFYADWGIPDTVTGRFNMIALHFALLLRRLRDEPAARAFTQTLIDLFFLDMDRSHRELGVTDLGVPRQIKKLGKIFYGIVGSVDDALGDTTPEALTDVLVRNIYMNAPAAHARDLAAYLRAEVERLDRVPTVNILAGHLAAEAAA